MKTSNSKYIIIALALISFVPTYAQNFAPIGAQWYFSKAGQDPLGNYTVYTSEKDTTVGGVLGKKIVEHKNSKGKPLGFEIMYSKNDSVFYWYDGAFRLIYDFTAKLGDTLTIETKTYGRQLQDTLLNVKGYVTKVSTVQSGNSPILKKIELNIIPTKGFENTYVWPSSFIYIEKVGNENAGNGFPFFIDLGTILEKPDLRCYNESSFSYKGYYFLTGPGKGKPCDYINVGLNEYGKNESLKIYPNPANDKFTVKLNTQNPSGAVKLYNLQGSVVLQKEVQENENQHQLSFFTSNLPRGIYLLEFVGQNGERENVKVVLQ